MFEKYKSRILLLLLMIMAIFLFVGGPYDHAPRSFSNMWNLGHILFFFLLNYTILKHYTVLSVCAYWRAFLILLVFSLCLGSVIEFLQWGANRSPDYLDVINDLAGCLIALAFFAPGRASLSTIWLRSLQILVVLMICALLLTTVEAFYDEYMARREFPILSDFEDSYQLGRWSPNRSNVSISSEIKKTGNASLKVNLTKARYSGVALNYFPRDWSAKKYLALSVYNASSQPLKITIRIHDDKHIKNGGNFDDRFNKRFVLKVGWNNIKIPMSAVVNAPKDRKMNLTKIMNVSIFASRLPERKTIYVDDVRLVDK